MPNSENIRHRITLYVLFFYFLPILLYSFFSTGWLQAISTWQVLLIGLLLAAAGSLLLFFKMLDWQTGQLQPVLEAAANLSEASQKAAEHEPASTEKAVNEPSEEELEALRQVQLLQLELETSQEKIQELEREVAAEKQAASNLNAEKKELKIELENLHKRFSDCQQEAIEQLQAKDAILSEYSQSVYELREAMDKKQQVVAKLESSVADLTYEIKTLLYLSEDEKNKEDLFSDPGLFDQEDRHKKPFKPSPLHTPVRAVSVDQIETTTLGRNESSAKVASHQEASRELKKCIQIAQGITGASHLAANDRFKELSLESYALDLRRLFDSLRSENRALVLVYSPREDKLLFVNNFIKTLLGWSPERFIQDYALLVKEGLDDWKKTIHAVGPHQELATRILVKTRSGQDQILHGQVGEISLGLFKGYVLSVFFSS